MPSLPYVKLDFEKTLRDLSDLEKTQWPFVLAKTTTQLAGGAAAAIRFDMPNRFHLRSRWEQLGVRIERAEKKDVLSTGSCTAIVKDIDPRMTLHELGGIKRGKGHRLGVPQKVLDSMGARTASGAFKKKFTPAGLLANQGNRSVYRKGRSSKNKPFLTLSGGKQSVAVRTGPGRLPLMTLYRLESVVKIKPRFQFRAQVEKYVRDNYEKLFAQNMAAALVDRKEK
jgi:hypothetical protein